MPGVYTPEKKKKVFGVSPPKPLSGSQVNFSH
jgi:hypothetical protein